MKHKGASNLERNLLVHNDSILITVIVPVYQAEKHLDKCINSILGQTYPHFELILIDDGSFDISGEICDKYAKIDRRVQVKHTVNQGVSAARNEGLALARGEYIAFVDSDDWIEPEFLETGVTTLLQEGGDLFLSGLQEETYQDGKRICLNTSQGLDKKYTIKDLLDAFNVDYPFLLICGPTCKLYRRDIIKTHNLAFDIQTTFGEDMLFNCDYLKNAKHAVFSSGIFYHYFRGNPDSLFSRYYKDMFEVNIPLYEKMLSLMAEFGCSSESIQRMEGIYTRVLVGCIYHEYMNCNQSTPSSRKEIIKKVAKHPQVKRCPLSNYRNPKDIALNLLLKVGALPIINLLFTRHYCKKAPSGT